VDALYTHPPLDPRAIKIDTVAYGDLLEGVELGEAMVNSVGTGGAVTKVSAARMATAAGIPTLLTATTALNDVVAGSVEGTWFEPALH
jgi:glutamate 5-kinase